MALSDQAGRNLHSTLNSGQTGRSSGRILLADADAAYRFVLRQHLRHAGYLVDSVDSPDLARQSLLRKPYHLLVVDISQPVWQMDWLLEQAAQVQPNLQFFILTAKACLASAAAAVRQPNIIDYRSKSLGHADILAAIEIALTHQAALEHHQALIEAASQVLERWKDNFQSYKPAQHGAEPPDTDAVEKVIIDQPPLRLNLLQRQVCVTDQPPVKLTRGEMAVLATLVRHPGLTLSCRELVQKGWNDELSEAEARSIIRPYISRLRKKLKLAQAQLFQIETIRRYGYRLRI